MTEGSPKPALSDFDSTCGRPGYYPADTPNALNRMRKLASPSSTLKSAPAYGFSHEKRPKPGAKQAWRLEMPETAPPEVSPGPIYMPNPPPASVPCVHGLARGRIFMFAC